MKWLKLLFFVPALLAAYDPWFTGPILTPTREIMPEGKLLYQPFFIARQIRKEFDSNWETTSVPKRYEIETFQFIQYGINTWLDIQFIPTLLYQHEQGAQSFKLADTPIVLDFQLMREDPLNYRVPSVVFSITEFFPTGTYQRLSPSKNFADASGRGSFVTALGVTAAHIFKLPGPHYLVPRINVSYELPASTHVEGFNFYGGGFGTCGTVTPGKALFVFTAAEYSITQNWVVTCDIAYRHKSRDRFSGTRGIDKDGNIATVGDPSSEQFRISPGLEYNVSNTLGILLGGIVTFAGRNVPQSSAGVFSITATF